jgi:hypothetical protein
MAVLCSTWEGGVAWPTLWCWEPAWRDCGPRPPLQALVPGLSFWIATRHRWGHHNGRVCRKALSRMCSCTAGRRLARSSCPVCVTISPPWVRSAWIPAPSLRDALTSGAREGATRRLIRDLDRVVDFPWAVAIGQDLQMPSCSGQQSRAQAAVSAWASQVGRRAVEGDRRAHQVLMRAYDLESSASALLHPALIASVALGRLRRTHTRSPRPAVLETLAT